MSRCGQYIESPAVDEDFSPLSIGASRRPGAVVVRVRRSPRSAPGLAQVREVLRTGVGAEALGWQDYLALGSGKNTSA